MELLIVLVLMGLVAALVSPGLSRFSKSIELKTSAQRVSGIMRYCRNEAIQRGKVQQVILDAAKGEVRVITIEPSEGAEGSEGEKKEERTTQKKYTLPPGIQIEEVKVAPPQYPADFPAIEFYPSGGSNGGSFHLDREDHKGYRIQVNFLTGIVEVKVS